VPQAGAVHISWIETIEQVHRVTRRTLQEAAAKGILRLSEVYSVSISFGRLESAKRGCSA